MRDLRVLGGRPSGDSLRLTGLPGDKSISHRILLLASLAPGTSRLSGLNRGEVVEVLVRALDTLGALEGRDAEELRVGTLARSFAGPPPRLDLGSSSTAARLLLGLLAGLGRPAVVDGERSLQARPMEWVVEPLRQLGAQLRYLGAEGRLPVLCEGGRLHPGRVHLTVGSAQARSAVLLAALTAGIRVEIEYPVQSRDHTERLLRYFGSTLTMEEGRLRLEPIPLPAIPHYRVPADPSAAAFAAAVHVLARGSGSLELPEVCLNPTRTGFFDLLQSCGVPLRTAGIQVQGGEPVGTILVGPASVELLPFCVEGGASFHSLIDEVPLAAAVGTLAKGRSSVFGAAELVFKETDRLRTTREMLQGFGAEVEVDGDTLHVTGGRPLAPSVVPSFGDHRIAMAAVAVASSLPGVSRIAHGACIAVSFPGFIAALRRLGCDVALAEAAA